MVFLVMHAHGHEANEYKTVHSSLPFMVAAWPSSIRCMEDTKSLSPSAPLSLKGEPVWLNKPSTEPATFESFSFDLMETCRNDPASF
jgi:hypothetical protein